MLHAQPVQPQGTERVAQALSVLDKRRLSQPVCKEGRDNSTQRKGINRGEKTPTF